MSMAKCKCGKVFDSDFEMSYDEKGNCCCDNCDMNQYESLINDLIKCGYGKKDVETVAEKLLDIGYRNIESDNIKPPYGGFGG